MGTQPSYAPPLTLFLRLPTITMWKGPPCGLAEANANVSLTFELRKEEKKNPNCGI